VGTGTF
jgi:hypothetical protein